MSPDESLISPLSPKFTGLNISDDKMAILLVTEPADFHSFLVLFPLFRDRPERFGVWMPVFGCPYKQPPQLNGINLTVKTVPDHHQFLHRHDSKMQGRCFVINESLKI